MIKMRRLPPCMPLRCRADPGGKGVVTITPASSAWTPNSRTAPTRPLSPARPSWTRAPTPAPARATPRSTCCATSRCFGHRQHGAIQRRCHHHTRRRPVRRLHRHRHLQRALLQGLCGARGRGQMPAKLPTPTPAMSKCARTKKPRATRLPRSPRCSGPSPRAPSPAWAVRSAAPRRCRIAILPCRLATTPTATRAAAS